MSVCWSVTSGIASNKRVRMSRRRGLWEDTQDGMLQAKGAMRTVEGDPSPCNRSRQSAVDERFHVE